MHLLHKLQGREVSPCKAHVAVEGRKLYLNVFPVSTSYSVQTPHIIFRKFTPDGKYLVCFAQNQHCIHIYEYRYPSSSQTTFAPSFSDFFKLTFEIPLTAGPELLCKDFLLFTMDKKFMIVSSAVSASSNVRPSRPGSLNTIGSLDDVTLRLIEISTGIVTDKIVFHNDHIVLANHSGVALEKNVLAITSVQHQCIYWVQIKSTGHFCPDFELGWNLNKEDELVLKSQEQAEATFDKANRIVSIDSIVPEQQPEFEMDLDDDELVNAPQQHSILKQRIMAFLFRRAQATGSSNALFHFYLTFAKFSSLVMCRMSFVDSENIIIKFTSIDSITARVLMPNKSPEISGSYPIFFVFYSLLTTKILGVYENTCPDFYKIYERWPCMRGVALGALLAFVSGPANSLHAREYIQRQMYAIEKARNGGTGQSLRRILLNLPINPQSFTDVAYYDHSLFAYDEKLINSSDRYAFLTSAKACGEVPCKFYCRKTGRLKFKLDPNQDDFIPISRSEKYAFIDSRRYSSYIFHPTDPFCLSVQHNPNRTQTVNLHTTFSNN